MFGRLSHLESFSLDFSELLEDLKIKHSLTDDEVLFMLVSEANLIVYRKFDPEVDTLEVVDE